MNRELLIQNAIRESVEFVTGRSNFSNDTSLLDRDLAIIPANFLYIFDMLEKKT